MSPKINDNTDYYFDENGLVVFTEKYHLNKGYCCGHGCRHCPFRYEAVPEPRRSMFLKNQNQQEEKLKSILPSNKKEASFFVLVYDVVRLIPKGRVTTYGAVATYLGSKMSARMVGWAMNGAHGISPKVPAHRVINRNGMLSGKAHFATPTLMEELLAKEKIFVKDDTVIDFQKKFWDPTVELEIN